MSRLTWASFRFARLTSSSERSRLAFRSLICARTCWASACVAAIVRGRLRRRLGGREKARNDREQHVWRQSSPRRSRQSRTGAPGGAGTSRGADVSNLFGHGQPTTVTKLPKPAVFWAGHEEKGRRLWYGPALALAGRGEKGAGSGRRGLLLPGPLLAGGRNTSVRNRPVQGSKPLGRRRSAGREAARCRPRPLLARRAARDGAGAPEHPPGRRRPAEERTGDPDARAQARPARRPPLPAAARRRGCASSTTTGRRARSTS